LAPVHRRPHDRRAWQVARRNRWSSASGVDIGARKMLPEGPGRTRPELRIPNAAAQRE
jgi:hypothetical protein